MKRALVSAIGTLALSTTALTQEFIELPEGFVIHTGEIEVAGAPSADGEEAEASDAANEERVKLLKKLKFDRRPSAILKAWATPPEPEEEEEPEKGEGEPSAEAEEGAEALATEEEAAVAEGEEPAAEEAEAEEPAEDQEGEEGEEPPAEEKTPEELEEEEEAAKKAAKEAKKAAEKAAKEAEKAAEKAREEAEKKALEAEMEAFQRNVTLGDWEAVRTYVTGLEESEAKIAYEQLLKSLVEGYEKPSGRFSAYAEKNFFAPPDIVGIAAAAPYELAVKDLTSLGTLLRQCVDAGSLVERSLERFEESLAADDFPLERQQIARVVIDAGFPVEAGQFLPEPEEAAEDREVLNLLARHYLATHAKEKDVSYLERAWEVTQTALADGEIEQEDKDEALKRAVSIAPKIREELGQEWLDESFTARPERGMEILVVIGSATANNMKDQARNADERFASLELQTTAANALLAAAPELAGEWAGALTLLATNWLREAGYTYQHDSSTSRGPNMQRDVYGNIFYYSSYNSRSYNSNMPVPISTDKMLDIKPVDAWLGLVDDGLTPKIAMVVAQLLLKVKEETEAFPYIERLALERPDRAKELVEEFLRVWAENHNPNSENSRTDSYMFIYGFEQRANAIPLTRSKQERNLVDLAGWIERINALPIEDVDEDLVARAFTSAHSTAEVYKIETIENVFGALDKLGPKTLAQLVQRMRTNLVGVWREPSVQKEKKTGRRKKDIQNEVQRGYEVAAEVCAQALEDHPDDWGLLLAQASVRHDENNYAQEVEKSTEFAGRREEAFLDFQLAAEAYIETAAELDEDEETAEPFLTWFYASLGACDLNAIDEEMQPVQGQIALIKEALEQLPPEAADRHMASFANSLFTRMSNVNPAVKFRYVRAGLEIVGEHERAREALDIYEYYRDLVTEIRLETRVDGGDHVGHEAPFGLFVDIRHTREIEREAGGFSKYLINQNNQAFGWNYGRPTENYRDKFEEVAREALDEQFEILSITFNHPDAHSRAVEEYGWRVTPYAYLLLQPRGPEVDRVPPLRLDLDFLDTSGYAVLPIESSPLAIDATAVERPERPFRDLELVQTLDERQAGEGKLVLEIKARALGLVPDLDEILDLAPAGFEIESTDDQGVSVMKFDEEGDDIQVQSERLWMIAMRGEEGLEQLPEEFRFGAARVETAEMDYQRFVDADLESVEPVVALEASYGERGVSSLVGALVAGAALVGLVVALVLFGRRGGGSERSYERFRMPEPVSPFTVLGLLRRIESENGVTDAQRNELASQIHRLEGYYFEGGQEEVPDLEAIAASWVQRAR
ncbi:MAG: hypothetical protein AAF682_21175 [Planctomycetota bacterium]